MLTASQKERLKMFLKYPDPRDEFIRDSIDEVREYKLRGRQSQQSDAAVALYFHGWRIEVIHGK
jgi:hypothetical protein